MIFKSTRRSRRQRNPQAHEQNDKPFFSKASDITVQTKEEAAFFQPSLTIGQPGDRYEQEADQMADAVTSRSDNPAAVQEKAEGIQRMNDSRMEEDRKIQEKPVQMQSEGGVEEEVQMQGEDQAEEEIQMQAAEEEEVQMQSEEPASAEALAGEEEEVQMQAAEEEEVQMQQEPTSPEATADKEEEPVQMRTEAAAPRTAGPQLSQRIKASSGRGKPMDRDTRTQMEQGFGVNFKGVNIHTGQEAVELNKSLGAQAFTHGNNIYFNTGKYQPESNAGRHLLAHELTHVVQQGKASKKTIQRSPISLLYSVLKFYGWWTNFPTGTAEEVKKKIGGKVDAEWITNTCAIRMSRVMNYSGFSIPYQGKKTISGADKKWYFYRISDLKPFIESKLGAPDHSFSPPYDMTELSKLKGIILFDVKVWSDATGHFTLWDGNDCRDKCYFNKASKIHLWLP